MEFHEKLQELRRQKGMTQEELAECLYVSRTAISKWESGRGYPNLESLKAISKFFSVTVDALLSADEALELAERHQKQTERRFLELAFGLTDVCAVLLFFLPFFSVQEGEAARAVSLLSLVGVPLYLKLPYFILVVGTSLLGVLELALQACPARILEKGSRWLSLSLGVASVLLFTLCRQPYAAVYSFVLMTVKGISILKRP